MIKHVAAAVAVIATPVALLAGCSNQSSTESTPTTTSGSAAGPQKLSTQLNTADGKRVADATVDFVNGYATVTVETVATGDVSPGFHGLHIHAGGQCDANAVATSGGQTVNGELPPLLVRSDGGGKLVATSDSFTEDQLKGPEGSSIVLLQGAEMGTAAAESGQRLACGVLSPASATSSSVSTSVSTSVVTTTATTGPPETVTETASPTSPAATTTTVSPSLSTSTSTVTVIQPPSIPPITVPAPPGG